MARDLLQQATALLGQAGPNYPERALKAAEHLLHVANALSARHAELEVQNVKLQQLRVELELWHSRYFDLYDLAPVAYCTTTEDGLILQTNLMAATLFDVPRCRLISAPLSRFVFAQDIAGYQVLRQRLRETRVRQSCDLRVARPDGTFSWVTLSAVPGAFPDATPVHHISLTDVTATVRAESLEQALDYSQALCNALPALIFINRRDGVFLDIQTASLKLLFPPDEHVLGRTIAEVFSEPVAAQLMAAIGTALDTRAVQEVGYPLLIGGAPQWFEARIAPTAQDNVVCVVQNVTERVLLAQQRQRSKRYDTLTQVYQKTPRALRL